MRVKKETDGVRVSSALDRLNNLKARPSDLTAAIEWAQEDLHVPEGVQWDILDLIDFFGEEKRKVEVFSALKEEMRQMWVEREMGKRTIQ